jgi:hypothetical protein
MYGIPRDIAMIFLQVYDGPSSSDTQLAKSSGSSRPSSVHTTGQYMYITFTSDGSIIKSGFIANIYKRRQ